MDGGNRRARAARVVAACAAAGVMAARAPVATEGGPGPAAARSPERVRSWRPDTSITPPPSAEWCIGPAVALHGDMLAAGPARDWDLGEDLGGVRLFRRSESRWLEAGSLMHPSADARANFGAALAMDDMLLAVGCPRDATGGFETGAVHMFRRHAGGWVAEGLLTRPEPSTSDLTGTSVALHGDTVVVGVPKADAGALDAGCAEVFRRHDGAWQHEATLLAPDPQIGALFGLSVAVDGDIILVGAPGDASQGPAAGRVHLYARTRRGWRWEGSVGCPTGPRAWFGASVAAARGLLVAGAPRASRPDSQGFVRGAAWRLERIDGHWRATSLLAPPDPMQGDAAGCALATDGSTVVLGATADGLRGDLAGCAFAFREAGTRWIGQRLDPEVAGADALVGHGVAVDGGWIAVGRLGNPEQTPGPGRVDLFRAHERWLDLSGPDAVAVSRPVPIVRQAGSTP